MDSHLCEAILSEDSEVSHNCTCGMSYEEHDLKESLKFIVQGHVQIGINVFGLVANSIAMNALLSKQLRSSLFNCTLFILGVFDFTVNICDILESIRKNHYDRFSCFMPSYQKLHLYVWPKFLYPLRMYTILASLLTTVAIAFERYFAVSKPIFTFIRRDVDKCKKVIKVIALIMFVSLVITLPTFYEFFTESQDFICWEGQQLLEINSTYYNHISNWSNRSTNIDNGGQIGPTTCSYSSVPVLHLNKILKDETYILVYRNIVSNTITYLLPLVLLFILNLLIYIHLTRRNEVIKTLGIFFG